jgi:cell shape-determining protein MreC
MKLLRNVTKPRVLVALMVAAMASSLLREHAAGPLRRAAGYALAPVGDAGMYVATSFRSELQDIGRSGLSVDEADRLRQRVEALERQTDSLANVNAVLRYELDAAELISDLYGRTADFPFRLMPARVVATDALRYGRTRLVNVGRAQGAVPGSRVTTRLLYTGRSKSLPPGLATITPEALVGRLTDESAAYTARLQLVTDPAFQTPAVIKRIIDPSRPRTIIADPDGAATEEILNERNNKLVPVWAEGDGAGGLVVREVTAYHNVLVGDKLMTSGDHRGLPIRIPIGTVEAVEHNPEDPQVVTLRVRPSAELDTLRHVYVVVSPSAGEGEGP